MLAKYVPGDIKYIFAKFYRHISTSNFVGEEIINLKIAIELNKLKDSNRIK
jgi:hypothetical protein